MDSKRGYKKKFRKKKASLAVISTKLRTF